LPSSSAIFTNNQRGGTRKYSRDLMFTMLNTADEF
jgi:hypothetical protein